MQVVVKSQSGNLLLLQGEANDTVRDLKEKLYYHVHNPPSQQRLIYRGKQLDDEKLLTSYSIANNALIRYLPVSKEEIRLNCNLFTGQFLSLNVELDQSICHVKELLHQQTNIPMEKQRLLLANKQLKDTETLRCYGMQENDTINMVLKLPRRIPLHIKMNHDKTITIEIESNSTVADIKEVVFINNNMPPNKQRLTYNGKVMLDSTTVDDYGLKNYDTIYMIHRRKSRNQAVIVQMENDQTLSVPAKEDSTIQEIKHLIEEQTNIPWRQQRLLHDDVLLNNSSTLADCQLQLPCQLQLFSSDILQIYIRLSVGKQLSLEVLEMDKIYDIKGRIEDKEGISILQQTLRFKGKILKDQTTLKSCDIGSGSILQLKINVDDRNCCVM
ncbi:uncharacterized protein TRIADDRAFT_29688 [Trichoplax adhaerens]|uniref:Ubiquitin-like domain-containing protein n=1 Tax=Trichoplax adhaerens TaxID=10228 RepID=B3S5X7_TRIAD|nr:hypothetical protein TRIADDRAFT_29688 [Trichoplax adhaerens]EDV21887.1 hypothetical protein TRIADDRAFT_29688 [Trichoplax adhaerens]|eukprot:XP_002115524.1 hypothetical protein TRIADDRAFT_29688 [Trichoplax adhaerens]